jgi:hypothetical protein
MMKIFTYSLLLLMLATPAAFAEDKAPTLSGDLIIDGTETGQPFYKDGVFKLGDQIVRIEQGNLPSGKKVQYNPEWNLIVVNNDPAISENDKGVALVGLLDALILEQTIMPAAGEETPDNGASEELE